MGLLKLIQVRKDAQWYSPIAGGESTCDDADIKAGLTAKLKDRSNTFGSGTVMYLDLFTKGGDRTSFKVSGSIVESIRESGAVVENITVDLSSVVVTSLKISDAAKQTEKGKAMQDVIYRASFSWA